MKRTATRHGTELRIIGLASLKYIFGDMRFRLSLSPLRETAISPAARYVLSRRRQSHFRNPSPPLSRPIRRVIRDMREFSKV